MLWPGPQASLDPQETVWLSAGCETRAWRGSCVLPTETLVLRGQRPCTLLCLSCPLTGNPGRGGGRTLGTWVSAVPCPQGLETWALQAAPHMGPSVPRPVPGLGPLGGTPSSGAGGPTAGGGQAGGPGLSWSILCQSGVWLGWGRIFLLCTRPGWRPAGRSLDQALAWVTPAAMEACSGTLQG